MSSKSKRPKPATTQRKKRTRRNRAHGACDKLPEHVQKTIKDWYLAGDTYEQISQKLNELGHKITLKQVWNWMARKRDELERIELARERAEVLAEHIVPEGSNIEGAAVTLIAAQCLEALSDADLLQIKSIEDLVKITRAVTEVQRSSVIREKWEHEKNKTIDTAAAALIVEVQAEVSDDEELQERLIKHIEKRRDQMKEKAA